MIELQVLGNDAIPLNVTETSTIPLEVTMTTGGGDITVEALSVTANGTYAAPSGKAYSPVEVDVEPNLQTLSKTITPSLNAIIRDYTPDSGYDGLAEVFVTVSGIPQGTAGTPTASKGSVSNHSVEVTPSVTNTTGYIEGGTKTGTAVTVSASELVSGTKSITANGTGIDVTNYESVDVAVSGGITPTGTISITSNGTTDVTNYATASVSVPNSYSASDEGKVVSNGVLVSQTSDTVTANDTYDTTLINSLTVNVSGGGGVSIDDIATNTAPSGAITLGSGVTAIADNAFQGKPITSISGANVTSIGQYSLERTSIESINDTNFPALGVSSAYTVILRMSSLKNIKLSGEYIRLDSGSNAFRNNTNLLTAEFPNAAKSVTQKTLYSFAFGGCTKLTLVDAGFINYIAQNAFNGSTVFNTLILRSTSVVTLQNVNAFTNTAFKNGGTGGTIYIPKTLYDHLGDGTSSDYQNASNWSTIHGYGTITWAKIEGSIYE